MSKFIYREIKSGDLYTTPGQNGDIIIYENSVYGYHNHSWIELYNTNDYITSTPHIKTRYFNCKRCGAVGQKGRCSYCGSAEE